MFGEVGPKCIIIPYEKIKEIREETVQTITGKKMVQTTIEYVGEEEEKIAVVVNFKGSTEKIQKYVRRQMEEQPLVVYTAEYMGGHPLYSIQGWVRVGLFEKYLKIKGEHEIVIPYEKIKKVGAGTGEQVTAGRIVLLGLFTTTGSRMCGQ